MIRDLVMRNRSVRRFNREREIAENELLDLVDLARMSASAANRQPLKFKLSWKPETNEIIFPKLAWAGYLDDWKGPQEGEKPAGYIIILGDTTITDNYFVDHGIAAQSILLGAVEKGLGGCMIAAFDRESMREDLEIPEHLEPLLVIALGEPGEKIVLEEVREDDIRYYRDQSGTHHVPKRPLKDIVLG
jgi:nitroreductase